MMLIMTSLFGSCQSQPGKIKGGIRFFDCSFEPVDWDNPLNNNKWIESKQEALHCNLKFANPGLNQRNPDVLYKGTAQYLFVIGGGDRWVNAVDCSAEIIKDTIYIRYNPTYHNDKVGETAPSLICMEIEKDQIPGYKKMKIVIEAAQKN